MAETSLVIQPLTGNEQAQAFSKIGYVQVTQDSLYVYSRTEGLLCKNALKNIRHIRYGEPTLNTSVDNNNVSTCRIYPNPTQNVLVIDNANSETAHIFDINGRLLQTVAIYDGKATVNAVALPQGVYLLLLSTQSYKFIKQ